MRNSPHVSFIIPLFNEAEVFGILVDRMDKLVAQLELDCEIVLVDDGSKDNTTFLMEELALNNENYHCVFLSRNFGHQRALTAGLDSCRGELVMILDADLQDPPELFSEFHSHVLAGFDVVYGVRTGRKEGLFKRASYNVFYKVLNYISEYTIPRDSGDFCLMKRRVVNAILVNREESRFIRGLRNWVGFKQIGVPYVRHKRAAGVPKYTFLKLLRLALDGLFNFSSFPIKALSTTGIIFIGSSCVYLAYTIFRKFAFQDVPSGFTALLFIVILFGGLQLLSLGILGEYIYRAFFQVKNRPIYIIDKKIVDKTKNDGE